MSKDPETRGIVLSQSADYAVFKVLKPSKQGVNWCNHDLIRTRQFIKLLETKQGRSNPSFLNSLIFRNDKKFALLTEPANDIYWSTIDGCTFHSISRPSGIPSQFGRSRLARVMRRWLPCPMPSTLGPGASPSTRN